MEIKNGGTTMRSSREIKAAVEAAGLSCRLKAYGHSYRAGGAIIIAPQGYWASESLFRPNESLRVRPEKTSETAFDPTSYGEGRGRYWEIFRLVPDTSGMVPVSEGQYDALPEDDRFAVRGNERTCWGRPEADSAEDISALVSGMAPDTNVAD